MLLIFALLCLVEFSAFGGCAANANENENEVDTSVKAKLNAEMLSAVRRGDIPGFRVAINKGALTEYGKRFLRYPNEKRRRIEDMMNAKMHAVEGLLFTKLVSVPSTEFLEKNQNDDRIFKVTLLPDTDLITPLRLNLSAIEAWNITAPGGMKPLHAICSMPDVEPRIVKYVLDTGADINERAMMNYTALDFAALSGNLPVVKFLVERGANPNDIMRTDSAENYEVNYHRFLKVFSSKDVAVPPGYKVHHSPLISAISEDHVDVVKYLLNVGADVNLDNQSSTVFIDPVMSGKTEMLETLFQHGLDIRDKDILGATVLHVAAEAGHLEIVKLLLKYGLDVKAIDNFGTTPLHVAALSSHNATLVDFLVNADSSLVNATTDEGFTPLILAEAGSDPWFYKCLTAAVARNFSTKNQECKKNATLGHHEEHVDIVTLLLNRGSRVNHQDDVLGWSTLHWAAAIGDLKVAKMLVENYGANVSIKSKVGMTPLDVANYFVKTKLSEYLGKAKST